QFHIYAIGTEECLNSIAKSVIVHSKKEWESTVKEILGSSYEMLCGHALQASGFFATHNAVFAHRGIVPLLRNVRSSAVATGLSLGAPGTKLGNKGGVGISFSLGVTSCIFVNSHLAAHQTNVRERNDHFFQISSELQQQQSECLPSPSNRGDSIGHPLRRARAERIGGGSNGSSSSGRARGGRGGERSNSNNSNSLTLPEVFDRVVWAGDLNYRVNVPRGAADLLLSRDMHGVLLKNEQLTIERDRGGPLAPFAGYREGPLNFRPTYKFDSGSDTYDTSSKRRVPAWTDRKGALGADKLHLRAYRSVPDLRTSDHRPVIASFVMEF
ncbi:unnamed protein product, partial [Laminaria digitata]